MKIRSDLPIKYYLNLHNEPGLKGQSSVLFDILQYLIKVLSAKQKQVTLDNLKFSSSSLKYVFGEKIKDETFKADLVKNIKRLIEDKCLLVEGETIKVTQKGLNSFYAIE